MENLNEKLIEVAQEYLDLQSRKIHPNGEFDKAGRFYLSEDEKCDCCRTIRNPSRAWPYSHFQHARSLPHLACKHGLDPKALRMAVKSLQADLAKSKIS